MSIFIPVAMLFFIFFLVRNQWVYSTRMQWLDKEDIYDYERCPNFNSMLLRAWNWSRDIHAWMR